MIRAVIRTVVLDIEGTTSSLSYVRDHLFPYSRQRLESWLSKPLPEVAEIAAEIRKRIGSPEASADELAEALRGWIDDDVKEPALKSLQGLIWQHGYASGELTSHVYDDVLPALTRWQEQGATLYVFSSGSVLAQQDWFRHTGSGDLLHFFSGHFDTRNPGPKADPASYASIASQTATEPAEILFCSDSEPELDAARTAGWHTLGVQRADGFATAVHRHSTVPSFDGVDLLARPQETHA
ncbi:acireductone synthase [Streptomyces sp. NBC_01142]|uniref:acireductone synthase n=1 Tax=Streptomyces sp. NBC_01142 TaxID=2975865 RepID=UPI00224D7F3C|nr:acireductone synthase [Streptomyces sp. NBC_01142]MCX4823156.1 acireductone synthase [Streptomyces sp. NBC_01142]